MQTRATVGGALAAHIRGSKRPENASKDPERAPVVLEEDRNAWRWAAKHMPKGRGRKPKPAIEFVVAGIPPYASKRYKREGWTREKELQFARDTLAWIKDRAGPNSRVAVASWHVDESAGHLHCLVVPVSVANRLGWTAIRNRFELGTGPASLRMSRLQDRFHADVAAGYGMSRGVKGSTAKHEAIDRDAAIEKLDKALAQLERLTVIWNAAKLWARRALKQLAQSPAVLAKATADFELISEAATAVGMDGEGWRPPQPLKTPQRTAEAAPGAKKRLTPSPKP